MSESKDIIPENWPPDIITILSKITPEDCAKIVDFINLSYQAGFFDGEGSIRGAPSFISEIINQDIECLQLYLSRHGGRIALVAKAGKIFYVVVDEKKIPVTKLSRNLYRWTMTGRMRGHTSRSYVEKTDFLLSILPLQHNPTKIKATIGAILGLGWSSRERWEHLIPGNIEVSLPEDNRVDVDEFFR